MTEAVRLAHWPHRVFGSMFGIFVVIAAALGGLGIYSVMAYSVGMRTREIGVRIALGASRAEILRLVLSRGFAQTALGLVLGLALAIFVTRGLRTLLVEVTATDPVTYCAVATFQAAVALLACWIPAKRAVAVDPVRALRE